ncbi:hypothetical protein [Pelagicoccus sp. SDUM812005]|uniref:hypothetical protein n=1 Tax=Pelagicoccus sp. SDUM812005 TaxID=3041257 RepID=UPI00280C3FA3|nr:hypothetical protein [Pelagicoccus sp. SDUM812005]MDQ8183427.1 hypothetical protein [Pelagicoccus sp. SDUM812005]
MKTPPHRPSLRLTTGRTLAACIAFFLLAIPAVPQDTVFTTVVSEGEAINSLGPQTPPTVVLIDYIEWSDEALGVRAWDDVSNKYVGFWYPHVGELEYVAGWQTPFPQFSPTSPTVNSEGDPPGNPILSSAWGFVNDADEFVMGVNIDDRSTDFPESWPTLLTAGASTGIQQFAQRFLTPVASAPNQHAFYVTGIDLEDNHGWVTTSGSVEILVDSDTPVPPALEDATHFFWSEPSKILSDRTSIHVANYNGAPAGSAIYAMSPSSGIKILLDSNGDVPAHPSLPDGGSWSSSITSISANDSGRILFFSGVSKLGDFSRTTLWSMDTSGQEPSLEASSFVAYPTHADATVTFDRVAEGRIDHEGNILFQARVDGESKFGVWRKQTDGKFIRISPNTDSPLPGFPGYTARTASIADMNTEGRCVIVVQGVGPATINAYYLESSTGSLAYLLAQGIPFGPDEESVSVTSLDLSDSGSVAMLLSVEVEGSAINEDRVVVARDPNDVQPSGNKYVWDGGAGTSNWHTVVDGRSNWVDNSGVPWDSPPNSEDAQIEIGVEAVVQLEQAIQLYSIDLAAGSLELDASLQCHGIILVREEASLVLKGFELDAQQILSQGLILKEGDNTASLTGESLSVENSDFIVEGGLLRLWCETTLDGSTLRVEGGTVNTGKIRFEGSSPRIEVLPGATLEIESPELTFASDTTISTTQGGAIKIGDSDGESTIATNFETEFAEERRVLELIGKGSIELFDPLDIPANAIVRNKSGFGIEAGLVVDSYEGDNLEDSHIDGLFENSGVIALKGGGFTGNFRNTGWLEATPRQSGDLPVSLNGINNGTVYLNARGLAYDDLTFAPYSKLILKEGVFKSIIPASDLTEKRLVFQKASYIDALSGNWTITFSSDENANLAAQLSVADGASLAFEKANTAGTSQLKAAATGSLEMEDLTFDQLKIQSEGAVTLTGEIRGVNDQEHRKLAVEARSLSLTDVRCIGSDQEGALTSFAFGNSQKPAGENFPHQGTFENVAFENNASLIIERSALVVTGGDLTISSEATVLGKLILGGDVLEAPFISKPLIYLGNESTKAHLQISSLPDAPISIAPIVEFINIDSTVTVTTNTVASLIARKELLVSPVGVLDFGNWVIEDHASCQLTHLSPIHTIGKLAKIQLGKPHPSLGSLSNLPTSNVTLVNLGTLILRDTALDMEGNTFEQQGTFEGKVIGNVQSVRNDVQGVIQLSGNIDIQGNLTLDTSLSLGASPGTGSVSGDLILLPGAEMIVEIGGSQPGDEFDFLEVGGTASLDGTLRLSLIDEYLPAVDASFPFLKFGSASGSFAEIDQSHMGRQRRFDLDTLADGLTLTARAIQISSYAEWRSHFFSESDAANDALSGPDQDPDADGLSNLSEYLHSTLPQQANPPPYAFDLSDPAALTAELQWAKNTLDYEWKLESSTELETWTTIPFTSQQMDDLGDKVIHRILLPTTNSSSPDVFYRFKAVVSE